MSDTPVFIIIGQSNEGKSSIVSTLVGILIFKEQFSFKNKLGVALAIVGIVIVAIA